MNENEQPLVAYEYALVPVSKTHAARVPLPFAQTPTERAAYLANLPAAVLADAERWPLPAEHSSALPAPTSPDHAASDAGEED